MVSRAISLVIVVGYAIGTYILVGELESVAVLGMALLPLACIWFPEEVADWMGTVGFHHVSSRSPALLVSLLGWCLLVLPAVIAGIAILEDDP